MKRFEMLEGATPLDDVSGLLQDWVTTLNDLNRVEAENIYQAQKKYLKKPKENLEYWFNVTEFKKIHKAMFGNVWAWAGVLRKSVTSIGVVPSLISVRLSELSADVVAWERESVNLTLLEKTVRIHHRLVLIHPFENGNGRFSRLIADRYLLAHGSKYPNWPIDLHGSSVMRALYIQGLKSADSGDYAPLIALMTSWMVEKID